jgi:hypothetical protein
VAGFKLDLYHYLEVKMSKPQQLLSGNSGIAELCALELRHFMYQSFIPA